MLIYQYQCIFPEFWHTALFVLHVSKKKNTCLLIMKKRTYIPVELKCYVTDDFTTDPASEGARPVVCLTAFIITLKVVQHGIVICVLHHNIENNLF